MPKHYLCYRAVLPLELDGKLDKPFWEPAPWTQEFVDIEGDLRPRPRFSTRVKMLWDDACFYIGAQMEEPNVWATLTQHDSVIFYDNDFEVFIDPDGDNHNYYEIEINALNTTWDLRLTKPYRDSGQALNEWEIPGFRSAVFVDGTLNDASGEDRGWSVEMAIPWAALGEFAHCPAPPQEGCQWRVNFSRVEWDTDIVDGKYVKVPGAKEHNWVWSPQGVVDMHWPERWGYVQFSTLPPGMAEFRPDPAEAVRDALMQVYHAQRRHFARESRYAESLESLALTLPPDAPAVTLNASPMNWTAQARGPTLDGNRRTWFVRDDSLLWNE